MGVVVEMDVDVLAVVKDDLHVAYHDVLSDANVGEVAEVAVAMVVLLATVAYVDVQVVVEDDLHVAYHEVLSGASVGVGDGGETIVVVVDSLALVNEH